MGGDVQINEETRRSLTALQGTTEYICTSGAVRTESSGDKQFAVCRYGGSTLPAWTSTYVHISERPEIRYASRFRVGCSSFRGVERRQSHGSLPGIAAPLSPTWV